MSKDNKVVVLVLVLVMGMLVIFNLYAQQKEIVVESKFEPITITPTPTLKASIELENVRMSKSKYEGYVFVTGTVHNDGDYPLKFLKIKVEYLDKDNNIIGTDWTYAVGSEGIKVNGKQNFEIMTKFPNPYKVEDYTFYIMDYDY